MSRFEDHLLFLARQPLVQTRDWQDMLQNNTAGHAVESLALKGNMIAALQWGRMLLVGHGVVKDEIAAFDWFQQVAKRGEVQERAAALNMQGRCYEHGLGVERDEKQAFSYYEQACQQGDVWAMFNLADCYRKGKGCLVDKTKAVGLYQQAADNGHVKSLNMLGLAFEEGEGVAIDKVQAAQYFALGAEKEDCWACFNHARFLMAKGEREMSLAWLEKSLHYQTGDYCQTFLAIFALSTDGQLRHLAEKAKIKAERSE